MERLAYYSNCVSWPTGQLDALNFICDEGKAISRATFLRHVQNDQIPVDWYPRSWDYAVAYFRLDGWQVYWYVHSAIEFVFADQDTIAALNAEVAKVI